MDSQKLVAIVGPTASGKSDLALEIARKYNGEIICADSRTIYKGMNIGTAKPSTEEQNLINHHCLDLIRPNEVYSVAEYKKAAKSALDQVRKRGRLPIMVGGSGLYIDAVIYDFSFGPVASAESKNMTLRELQEKALNMGLDVPEQIFLNARHLVGYIEREGKKPLRKMSTNALIIGLDVSKDMLDARIGARVEAMFSNGLVEEVRNLLEKYPENSPGFLTPGYRPIIDYVKGRIGLDEAKDRFITNDKKLARRQRTWFARNKDIHWVASAETAEQIIQDYLR